MSSFNFLAIGDVVGPESVAFLSQRLWNLRRKLRVSFTAVNGENACTGNGIDAACADMLLDGGADVITTGNHVWQKKSFRDYLNDSRRVIRPANYPAICPGCGWTILDAEDKRVLVMNVMGTVFLDSLDSPFTTVERILEREVGKYDISVLDIHAEATSEKIALARYFDGRINCIYGTHTHVQTADERVFPGGSGYITDLGMTGPADSVLGVKCECIIEKMTAKMPVRFELAEGRIEICGALFTYDDTSRKVTEIKRIHIKDGDSGDTVL